MTGGFGVVGAPETLLKELSKTGHAKELTLAAVDSGPDNFGIANVVASGKVKKFITSYIGESKTVMSAFFDGKLELELVPQGTLTARMNAAGNGTPAFFSHTGVNTMYSDGGIPVKYSNDKSREVEAISQPRSVESIEGEQYILEHALRGDLALVKAWKADTAGNLVFHGTAQNSNPDIAKASLVCIAEAEEIVEAGEIDPDAVHLPGIYVHRVIRADDNAKPLEKIRAQDQSSVSQPVKPGRERIMRRLAKEVSRRAGCRGAA